MFEALVGWMTFDHMFAAGVGAATPIVYGWVKHTISSGVADIAAMKADIEALKTNVATAAKTAAAAAAASTPTTPAK